MFRLNETRELIAPPPKGWPVREKGGFGAGSLKETTAKTKYFSFIIIIVIINLFFL